MIPFTLDDKNIMSLSPSVKGPSLLNWGYGFICIALEAVRGRTSEQWNYLVTGCSGENLITVQFPRYQWSYRKQFLFIMSKIKHWYSSLKYCNYYHTEFLSLMKVVRWKLFLIATFVCDRVFPWYTKLATLAFLTTSNVNKLIRVKYQISFSFKSNLRENSIWN